MSVLIRRTRGERLAYLDGAISAYSYIAARGNTPPELKAELAGIVELTEKSKELDPVEVVESEAERDERVRAKEARAWGAVFHGALNGIVRETTRGIEIETIGGPGAVPVPMEPDDLIAAVATHDARIKAGMLGELATWFDAQKQPWASEAAALVRAIKRTHELRAGVTV